MKPSISLYEKNLTTRADNERKNINTVTAICLLATAASLSNATASVLSVFNDYNGWPPAWVALGSSILLASMIALRYRLVTCRLETLDKLEAIRRYRRDIAIHANPAKHADPADVAGQVILKMGRHL